MKVIVGSNNPVKIEAVTNAFNKVFPAESIEVNGYPAKSGVSEQPMSDDEMMKGAKNRALAAFASDPDADYGVGLEGGLHEYNGEWYGRSWMAVVDESKKFGLGSSVSCYIPPHMMELVHQGKDLRQVCEELYGIKDIGKKAGYFGLLTKGLITRTSGYTNGVIMALTTFINPEIS